MKDLQTKHEVECEIYDQIMADVDVVLFMYLGQKVKVKDRKSTITSVMNYFASVDDFEKCKNLKHKFETINNNDFQ